LTPPSFRKNVTVFLRKDGGVFLDNCGKLKKEEMFFEGKSLFLFSLLIFKAII